MNKRVFQKLTMSQAIAVTSLVLDGIVLHAKRAQQCFKTNAIAIANRSLSLFCHFRWMKSVRLKLRLSNADIPSASSQENEAFSFPFPIVTKESYSAMYSVQINIF